jgi:hypothetical protein
MCSAQYDSANVETTRTIALCALIAENDILIRLLPYRLNNAPGAAIFAQD